ncbi:hypothetical protein [Galactobacillus timonensis]|uniref:hypothetical protein n=1 Tax=Galactobacillus timonensis TaxID=2041840 RepID=UPI000C835E14|nr:hypothetical protein [Galactobacillus timonensis]
MPHNNTEEMMYKVMTAIYDSGLPIGFKGSLVLKAFLRNAGFEDDLRTTKDIDANWSSSDFPTDQEVVNALQKAVDRTDLGLVVTMTRQYGEGRSAGFVFSNPETGMSVFSMDMDINRQPIPSTQMYEDSYFHFRGVLPSKMIADKVTVVSSDKVFRRVKDVIDLYYFSSVVDLDADKVMKTIEESGRELGDFNAFLHRKDELQHAYEKFRFGEDIYKPSFEEVYQTTHSYLSSLMPLEKDKGLMIG